MSLCNTGSMALNKSFSGDGVARIFYEDLECHGQESKIMDCNPIRRRECSTYEVATLKCAISSKLMMK